MPPEDRLSIIRSRHCTRAFLDVPVARAVLEDVLTAAANAPSTRNAQPWRVAVVSGPSRDRLSRELCDLADRGLPPAPHYRNRPDRPDPVVDARAAAIGTGLFALKGIHRDDVEARRLHHRENFLFFGAPVELVFHLPSDSVAGTFLDMGFYIQNVMVGLVAYGLGSCPQYSVAGYGDHVRRFLGLEPDRIVVCGMAVGHPDPAAPVNNFVPTRAPISEYVSWHEDDPSPGQELGADHPSEFAQ